MKFARRFGWTNGIFLSKIAATVQLSRVIGVALSLRNSSLKNAASALLSSVALCVLVAACASSGGGGGGAPTGSSGGTGGGFGGGGSGGGGGGGGTPPPTANSFRTAEYLTSWALDAISAAEAYALGYTGEGVVIGVVDFNFTFGSSEVDYHAASIGANAQAVAWYEAIFGADEESVNHGHAVAATAAGAKNNSGIHGVAFDARVLAVDYFANVNGYAFESGGRTYHVSDPWTYLISRGVKIINKSYGYDEGDGVTVPSHIDDIYINETEVLAIAGGALLVSSAGNNGDKPHGFQPSLANRDIVADIVANGLEDGPGAFVISGSVRRSGDGYAMSDFSNRAGAYAEYFITAPGEEVVFPMNASECAPSFLCVGSGTSFSAPLVTGAAALILQRWPHLKGRQLADILFESATDLGAPGIDELYGHGMLNVEAALQPIGVTTLSVDGGIAATADTAGITLGAPFGDAPELHSVLTAVPIRDSYDRDFGIDFSSFVWSAPRSDLSGYLQQKTRWNSAAYALGMNARFAVQLYDDPALPYQGANGLEEPDDYRGVVSFTGVYSAPWGVLQWTAGTGLGLGPALSDAEFASVAPITRAFSTAFESQQGQFVTARMRLSEKTRLSFGVSHARQSEMEGHYLDVLDDGAALKAVAFRVDHRQAKVLFSFEVGSALEKGSVLGALGTGALTLAERSVTAWTTGGVGYSFDPHWSFRSAATVSLTRPDLHPGSLIASLGPVIATSASFGVARSELFTESDALSFTVHQPLRVEHAPLTLFAAGVDPVSGAARVDERQVALTPSGREIGFEIGYGADFGAWRTEAKLAYRLDAGHIAGRDSAAALLWLSRRF